MRALVIANGSMSDYGFYKGLDYPFVICADGGLRHARALGIEPDILIGDLDSADKAEVSKLPPEKVLFDPDPSKTDVELALEYIDRRFGKDCLEILLLGAIGDRLDHTISNIHTISLYRQHVHMLDENNDISIIHDAVEFAGPIGATVSLLPLTSEVTGVRLSGLKYDLPEGRFYTGFFGVSNVIVSNPVKISIESGKLVLFKTGWERVYGPPIERKEKVTLPIPQAKTDARVYSA